MSELESSFKKLRDEAANDPRTNNWATFALGTQCDADSPKLREALFARLNDEDQEVRGEAVLGLARRHDPRALAAIKREFENDEINVLVFEAAEALAAPELCTVLKDLLDTNPGCALIQRALDACSGIATAPGEDWAKTPLLPGDEELR